MGIDEEMISHIVQASDQHEIVVLKPLIDKMKINFSGLGVIKHTDVENAYKYWEGVYGLAKDALKDHWFDNVTPVRIDRYKVGMKVDLEGDAGSFTMGLDPRIKSNPSVTIEFNPSCFDYTSIMKIAKFWSEIAGNDISFPKLMSSATCSRIDIAFDILNVCLADLIVYRDNLWKVTSYGTYGEGTETQRYYPHSGYLKKAKSPQIKKDKRADVVVYDKRAEQLAKKAEPRFGPLQHTRIEFLIDRKGGKLRTLPNMKFPKKNWHFRRIVSDAAPFEMSKWRMFLDSARFRGYQAATSLLTAQDQKTLPAKGPASFPDDLLVPSMWDHWLYSINQARIVPLLEWADMHPTEFKY